MDPIFEKFSQLWSKSLLDPTDKSAAATVNSQFFHKARLDSGLYQDMLDLLKEEFYNCKHNIFETHLYLIEKSLNEKGVDFKFARAAFINQAFSDFYNQLKNLSKRSGKEQPARHFSTFCKENEVCYCQRDHTTIVRAFEIVVNKNILMLSSFNKIYNFSDNLEHLLPTVEVFMKKTNFIDQATLVGELQLQEMFSIDDIVIPLMLIDKYPSIDDYINRNEKVLLKVVNLIDRLCSPDFNLRELANSYEYVQKKKVDKFKPKILAKYASGCLKRCQKFHLIASDYKNIEMQLKITQMRFLVNLKYDKWGGDPISFEAWQELIMDLIGEQELLQTKLLFELIQYQKDIETAHKFLHQFGYEKSISKLPESLKEFYAKNIELITNEKKRDDSAARSRSGSENKYYYPHQLLNEANIKFVGSTEDFVEMLDFFESSKPSVIGLDCEWKPSFEQSDTSNKNDKKNHASTLQVSTRDNSFVIDIKFLIEKLSPEILDRFGHLVLFNENLLKLGYSFQQDAKKMSLSFPMFVHKFNEFEEDVVNIDEVVSEFQKNWNLFPNSDTEDQPSGKKSRSAKGLSGLTKKCFGAPLDKSECLSNWDNRPLRLAQLKYGALDAFVLIQIHDFIQARSKELGVNFSYSSKKNYF